jgi:hypothetical protein
VALEIAQTFEVAAPAGTVWAVITDLGRYPEWNPFVVRCVSTLEPRTPIDMRVRVFPGFAQPQREEVFEHVPGQRLSYGIRQLPLGVLSSRRSHEVEALGPDRTRYVSRFRLGGWLAPVVSLLLGRRLEQGFAAMSTALVRRAEAVASGRVS